LTTRGKAQEPEKFIQRSRGSASVEERKIIEVYNPTDADLQETRSTPRGRGGPHLRGGLWVGKSLPITENWQGENIKKNPTRRKYPTRRSRGGGGTKRKTLQKKNSKVG